MKQRRRQLWPSPASASCARRSAAPAVPPRAERLGAKALSHGRANTQTPSRRHCAPSQTEHTQSVSRRHSRAGTHAHRRTHRCEGSAARRRRRRPSGMTMIPDLGTFLSCHYPPASPGSSGCRGRRARRRLSGAAPAASPVPPVAAPGALRGPKRASKLHLRLRPPAVGGKPRLQTASSFAPPTLAQASRSP